METLNARLNLIKPKFSAYGPGGWAVYDKKVEELFERENGLYMSEYQTYGYVAAVMYMISRERQGQHRVQYQRAQPKFVARKNGDGWFF